MGSLHIKTGLMTSTNSFIMDFQAAPSTSNCATPSITKQWSWLSLIINHGAVSSAKQLDLWAIATNAQKEHIAFSNPLKFKLNLTIAKVVTKETTKARRSSLARQTVPISLPHVDIRSWCTRRIICLILLWNARKSTAMKSAWAPTCANRVTMGLCVTSVRRIIIDLLTMNVMFVLLLKPWS